MALFDTDVLIDVLREIPGAREDLQKLTGGKKLISVITYGEVLFGMRGHETGPTLALLSGFQVIKADKEVIELAYDVKNKARGHNLELYDCIIAATAIIEHQAVVTGNKRHFPDPRLKVIVPEYKSLK